MKKRPLFFLILMLSFVAFSLIFGSPKDSYGASKGSGPRAERIRVAFPSMQSLNFLPFEMGKKKGQYLNEGIDLEILLMTSHISTVALANGNIEYSGPVGDIIRAAAAGIPIKLFFVVADRLISYLITKPEIKSVKELKGKKIGVGARGSSTWFAAREMAKHFGLDPDKDITIVPTGAAMILPALFTGSIDAVLEGSPKNIIAKRRGYRELLMVGDIVEIPSIGLGTTEKRIKEKPIEVKKMIRATLKSMLYIKANRSESIDFMIKEWQLDKELAQEGYDSRIRSYTKDGIASEKGIQNNIDMARELGMIKGEVPLNKLVDFSIVKEVKKELGI